MILTKASKLVLEQLHNKGFKGYVVGGACRNYLIGKPITDVDVTTNATPNEIIEVFKNYKIYKTGLKHGTVTVNVDGELFEITTFRKDGEYIQNRKPKSVEFVDDLRQDLKRRDFTINAICYNQTEGFIDLFGGKEDCRNKIIKTVGDANLRFTEDALRILRALRFSSTLSFKIEEKTQNAILNNRRLLLSVSKERIYSELTKILTGENVEYVLTNFKEIFFTLFESLKKCDKFEQKSRFHAYDVYTHIVKSIKFAENDKVIRLALLFHDVEKPSCFSQDDDGVGHFYTHQEKSANRALEILNELKVDNKTKRQVYFLIKNHDIRIEPNKKSIKEWLFNYGVEYVNNLFKVKIADAKAHEISFMQKRIGDATRSLEIIDEIILNNECFTLKDLKIKGDDLIKKGYKGEEINEKLTSLLLDVINERVINEKESLLKLI